MWSGASSAARAPTLSSRGLGDRRGVGRTIGAFGKRGRGLVVMGADDGDVVVRDDEIAETMQERSAGFRETGWRQGGEGMVRQTRGGGGWVRWVDAHRDRRGYGLFPATSGCG